MIPVPSIPRLALIGDRFSRQGITDAICGAVEAGVPWVHLRDHELGREQFEEAAIALVDRLRAVSHHVFISINTRISVVAKLSAENYPVLGLHVGSRGPTVEQARASLRADTPIGLSVHAIDEVCVGGVDYYLWSPVFPTGSKPGHPGSGIQLLREAAERADSIPVIAMGGITPGTARACLEAGAHGVAVLSGILGSDNISETVHEYLDTVQSS